MELKPIGVIWNEFCSDGKSSRVKPLVKSNQRGIQRLSLSASSGTSWKVQEQMWPKKLKHQSQSEVYTYQPESKSGGACPYPLTYWGKGQKTLTCWCVVPFCPAGCITTTE